LKVVGKQSILSWLPASTSVEATNKIKDGGHKPKLILFNLEKPCQELQSLKAQKKFPNHQ
jgi:hypothetical protein